MSKLITPGRTMFALGIIALGILQFFAQDFVVARPPSPQWAPNIPGKITWAYISGVILIIAGLAIAVRVKAQLAALFVGIFILIFSFFLRHLPDMIGLDPEGILWSINAHKAFVFFGGSLIVAASFSTKNDLKLFGIFSNQRLITIGIICLSFFLIVCGAAHFKFHQFVPMLIPDYIPVPIFWTYFAGVALMAGGVGLIFKQTRRWAAALSGLMIFLWFLLLHLPRAFATPDVYDEWMGVCESLTFSGILFLVAGLNSNEKDLQKNNSAGVMTADSMLVE